MSNDYSSKQLLVIGFGIMLLLLFLVTLIGLLHMRNQDQGLQYIVDVRNVKTDLIFSMRNIARERSLTLYNMVIEEDPFKTDEGVIQMSLLAGQFIGMRDQFRTMDLTASEQYEFDHLLKIIRDTIKNQNAVMALLKSEDYGAANKALSSMAIPAQRKLLQAYDEMVEAERTRARQDAETMAGDYRRTFLSMLLLGASLLILGILISVLIIRKYTRIEEQLRELNTDLEDRVEERTSELRETNENLKKTLSSLHEAQDQLIQSEKMASLGSLVAGISHEINTPIGIGMTAATHLEHEMNELKMSYAEGSMKRSALEGFIEHAIESSEIIVRNLKRAADLIRSFKRVAVDQTSEDWHEINVYDYINDVITSLRPRLKNTKIQTENLCDPEVKIYTNPGAIYQIVSNLILNSIVHAFEKDQDGLISIRTEHEPGQIRLIYQDNGKGIPSSALGNIFDPFFTTRRGSGGSGLGLHLVYNLVNSNLKGDIHVDSEPGQGTRFTLTLPINYTHHKAA